MDKAMVEICYFLEEYMSKYVVFLKYSILKYRNMIVFEFKEIAW